MRSALRGCLRFFKVGCTGGGDGDLEFVDGRIAHQIQATGSCESECRGTLDRGENLDFGGHGVGWALRLFLNEAYRVFF